MEPPKGLIVSVYRNASHGDCTMNGISNRHNELTLIGDGVSGPFAPAPNRPAVRLVRRKIGRTEYLSAIPDAIKGNGAGLVMFGGNFIHTSDSRFPSPYPIPVHDRIEHDASRIEYRAKELPGSY